MHILDILNERSTDDLSAHAKAREAYHLLSSYVYNSLGPDFHLDINKKGEFYGLDPHLLGFDRLGLAKVIVLVGLYDPKSLVMAGAVWNFDNKLLLDRFNKAIVVYGMHKFTEKEFRSTVNSVAFLTTFSHEFIHVLDYKRTNDRIQGKDYDPHTDRKAYYNDPAELNAYFHTFADNWLGLLKDIKTTPEDMNDYTGLYGFTGDFSTDLKNIISNSLQSQIFFKHLTQKNRKSIIGRLYQLHHEITQTMNKASQLESLNKVNASGS